MIPSRFRTHFVPRLLLLVLCGALVQAMSIQRTTPRSVRGAATYRERIALPANAVLEATLEDVSRADAASEVIARVRNENPGNPPIPFVIAFDASRIQPGHRYAVRARILVDGRIWFSTDQNYRVLSANSAGDVQLLLRRVAASGQTSDGPSRSTLENTYWKLIEVGGARLVPASGQPEPRFILHSATKTVSGSGSCNRFSGTYEVTGERVSFGKTVSTMMACVGGMQVETRFHLALEKASRWRIDGQQLELFDDAGIRLARFQAVPPA
jgi:putative lipoprotein